MEVEKCLFKIHERTLGVSCCFGFMRICFTIFLLLSMKRKNIFIIKKRFNLDWYIPFREYQI